MTVFEYTDMNGRPAKAGLTLGVFEGIKVCIFSELNSNPGASVTNSATEVINQARDNLKLPDDTRYFEHYHWHGEQPSIDEVCTTLSKEGKVVFAEWQRMDDTFTTNLIRYITFSDIEGEYEKESA